MAWTEVTVKKGKEEIPAMARGSELSLPNVLGDDPKSVTVNGESCKVASSQVDERDDVIYIMLADASFNTAQEEIADDEPAEGGDPDNSGG